MSEPLILAIDQGTTGTTSAVVTVHGEVLSRANVEFPQHFPAPGWVEHEPLEIWDSVLASANLALDGWPQSRSLLRAVGLTNQRETMVLWDRASHEALGRALVWQDRRTSARCEELRQLGHEARVRDLTGLVIDPYFSATKLEWLLASEPGLRKRASAGSVCFGTIDSYLLMKLTNGVAPHQIEVTNASRTLLMDLRTRKYSEELLELFQVPREILPTIRPSAGFFGATKGVPGIPDGLPVSGVAGDQHAALFGQGCVQPGEGKCTYGTGAFVLVNTGAVPIPSRAGLLTTLGWEIEGEVVYALEGACFIAGAAVQWLRDGLGIIQSAADVEALARSVASSEGVTFVPALAGLGAPYWDAEARGLLTGITRGTTKAHIARATLEAIALQVDALLVAMQADLGGSAGAALTRLAVDGGAAKNDLLLELQADFSGLVVERPVDIESTVRGAALLAAVGAKLLPSAAEAARKVALERSFRPNLSPEEQAGVRARWEGAVRRARGAFSG